MAAIFRQIEDVAVGEPGQLGGELVALARGRTHAHGEAVVDNAGNLALDPADMVEIGDHAVADIADAGRQQGQPAGGHIDDLARKFAAVRQHIAPQQMNPHTLKTPSLFGGRRNRFFVRQSHLRHPTTGCSVSPDPTASRVNEWLAGVESSANHTILGLAAGMRLKHQRMRGHSKSSTAPKSNAAAALPVHLAQAPATTGPNIMQA